MVFLKWLKRLEFDFLIPEIIENCSFISDKYKKEEHPVNVFLHQLSVPLTLASITCLAYGASVESFALYGAATGGQIIGHITEGLFG